MNFTPPNEQVLDWVNELMQGATPIGAYCMGMGCVACSQAEIETKYHFLAALRKSTSVEAAEAFIDDWIEEEVKARTPERQLESAGVPSKSTSTGRGQKKGAH